MANLVAALNDKALLVIGVVRPGKPHGMSVVPGGHWFSCRGFSLGAARLNACSVAGAVSAASGCGDPFAGQQRHGSARQHPENRALLHSLSACVSARWHRRIL